MLDDFRRDIPNRVFIANNAEIDVIWDTYRQTLEPLRAELNAALDESWQQRIAHRQEIDASIAANANFEYLYDKPYEDRSKVRVAGVPQAQKADKIDFTAVTGWPGECVCAQGRFMEGVRRPRQRAEQPGVINHLGDEAMKILTVR